MLLYFLLNCDLEENVHHFLKVVSLLYSRVKIYVGLFDDPPHLEVFLLLTLTIIITLLLYRSFNEKVFSIIFRGI